MDLFSEVAAEDMSQIPEDLAEFVAVEGVTSLLE